MTPKFLQVWKREAKTLAAIVKADQSTDFPGWEHGCDRFWSLLERRHSKEATDNVATLLPISWSARDEENGTSSTYLDFRRVMLMSHAMATKDYAGLPRADLAYLVRVGLVSRSSLPDLVRPHPGRGFDADLTYAYVRRKGRSCRYAVQRHRTWIERVDPSNAPVVLSLPVADGEVAYLEVRETSGALYRPLLAPGRWKPISEAEFIHACRGVEAWADDPLNPGSRYRCPYDAFREEGRRFFPKRVPPLAPLEAGRADPFGTHEDDGSGPTRAASIGGILSIDGTVHVPVPEPRIRFTVVRASEERDFVRMDWRCGTLSSDDSQSTFTKWREGSFHDVYLPWMPATRVVLAKAVSQALAATSRKGNVPETPLGREESDVSMLPDIAALISRFHLAGEHAALVDGMRQVAEMGIAGDHREAERQAKEPLEFLLRQGPSRFGTRDALTALFVVLTDTLAKERDALYDDGPALAGLAF